MQLNKSVVKTLLFVIVTGSTLWAVALLSVIGNIYLSHAIPHSFSDWIVNVQIRDSYWPGQQPHSILFYQVRFYAVTTVILCAGALSAFYLKRLRQSRNRGNQA